jgi:hypothetical protein
VVALSQISLKPAKSPAQRVVSQRNHWEVPGYEPVPGLDALYQLLDGTIG